MAKRKRPLRPRRAKFRTARPGLRRAVRLRLQDSSISEDERAALHRALVDDRFLERGYEKLAETEEAGGLLASLAKILASLIRLAEIFGPLLAGLGKVV